MEIEVGAAIGPDGFLANKITIKSGGFKKLELPEEYLRGDCFWVKKGKNAAFILRSRVNPLTQEKTETRKTIKIPLDRTFTDAQVERLVAFMREAGARLVNIRTLMESGLLETEPIVVEI
jgi:hypothetical protein